MVSQSELDSMYDESKGVLEFERAVLPRFWWLDCVNIFCCLVIGFFHVFNGRWWGWVFVLWGFVFLFLVPQQYFKLGTIKQTEIIQKAVKQIQDNKK